MAEANHDFSRRVMDAMERKGFISRSELAKRVGCSQNSMTTYLNKGRVPEWDILASLAEVLGVSVDWLLLGRESIGTQAQCPPPGYD